MIFYSSKKDLLSYESKSLYQEHPSAIKKAVTLDVTA